MLLIYVQCANVDNLVCVFGGGWGGVIHFKWCSKIICIINLIRLRPGFFVYSHFLDMIRDLNITACNSGLCQILQDIWTPALFLIHQAVTDTFCEWKTGIFYECQDVQRGISELNIQQTRPLFLTRGL